MKTTVSITLLLALSWSATKIQATQVDVSVYYETNCPDCRSYWNQVTRVANQLGQYINLNLVPCGKCHMYGNSFSCQHGQAECFGNMIQTCALHNLSKQQALQFISCMFSQYDYTNTRSVAQRCANQQGIQYSQLESCAQSQQGHQWMADNARKTGSLSYVPWATVDGQRVTGDLVNYICSYKLRNAPECRNFIN